MIQSPRDMLDTMLGYLGFAFQIEEQERDGHAVLQIYTHDPEPLIGHHEQVLEDLQTLLNRMIQAKNPDAPRIIVDVEHHRQMRDDALVHKVKQLAESVRFSGRSIQTEPLNSYDRRLVHNAFQEDPEITTWSPNDDSRVKRITIKRRASKTV